VEREKEEKRKGNRRTERRFHESLTPDVIPGQRTRGGDGEVKGVKSRKVEKRREVYLSIYVKSSTYKAVTPVSSLVILSRCNMCGGLGSLDGDANFTRMKAALDLSVRDSQRSFYTYRRSSWQMPVLRRCIPENRRVGGMLMRIGDANFTQLSTPLHLSIRRFQRRFYTYRRQIWPAPAVR
jgi:hypothetical protein